MVVPPGSAVLIGTSSPAAAAQLAGLVDARLILRLADPSLAAILAASAGGEPGDGLAGDGRHPVAAWGRAYASAVSAGALLSLGPGEFALTVSEPSRRLVALGGLVPARLPPRPPAGSAGGGGCALTPRKPDQPLYLGWEYATPCPDPGPPPRRPVPPEREPMSADWLAAQRREERLINRPLKIIMAVAAGIALALGACVAGGLLRPIVAAPTIAVFLAAAALAGYAIWRGERVLRDRIEAERKRVERLRADQESRHFAGQAEHARLVSRWQRQRSAFETQKRWYGVPVPAGIDRVDVAGGTLAGWSALLTMVAAGRLAAGGEVTVIDLSGGAVAADLVDLSIAAGGVDPAVWVLPRDLPRLDLAASLAPGELADVLALSVSVAEERSSARELAVDSAILDRVIGALDGSEPSSLGRVAAALRALAQVGDLRADVAAGLITEREAAKIAPSTARAQPTGWCSSARSASRRSSESWPRPAGSRSAAARPAAGDRGRPAGGRAVGQAPRQLRHHHPHAAGGAAAPAAGRPRGVTRSSCSAPSDSAMTYSTA